MRRVRGISSAEERLYGLTAFTQVQSCGIGGLSMTDIDIDSGFIALLQLKRWITG